MAAELNMYQAQVNEYKYEIERLTRELQEMKRRYFEQKRREQNQREAQSKAQGGYQGIQAQTGPQQRFTGGGFNLAIWAVQPNYRNQTERIYFCQLCLNS